MYVNQTNFSSLLGPSQVRPDHGIMAAFGASVIDGFKEFSSAREFGLSLVLCFAVMVLVRLALNRIILRLLAQGALREHVALVGTGERAARIVRHLTEKPTDEIALVGVFDDRQTRLSEALEGCPLLGTTDDLVAEARRRRIDRIIVTLPWTAEDRLNVVLSKLRTIPCMIHLCPANVIWDFRNSDINQLAGIPLVAVANRQVRSETELLKWLQDKILASILLILAIPLMLIVVILIKLDSRGLVIFRQPRLGYNNRTFEVLKFRTMYADGDASKSGDLAQVTRDDPR